MLLNSDQISKKQNCCVNRSKESNYYADFKYICCSLSLVLTMHIYETKKFLCVTKNGK